MIFMSMNKLFALVLLVGTLFLTGCATEGIVYVGPAYYYYPPPPPVIFVPAPPPHYHHWRH